jgi:acetyl esterase
VADHASELGADAGRMGVAGDSSGGNLAAVMALMARDDDGGPSLSAQVLAYPPTRSGAETESMRDNKDTMFFNAYSSAWFWSHYLAEPSDGDSPLASPLNAPDLSGLPPTLVVTAEYCPLRDEGEAYANALLRAGVLVEYHRYGGLPHGFLAMAPVLDTAKEALGLIAGFLRRRLK